jgi:hypothetical protein
VKDSSGADQMGRAGAKKAAAASRDEESAPRRIVWTAEMHEVFYEEAAARQHVINRALSRNSSSMTTREAKWKPLLTSLNARFADELDAPQLTFDQLMQKINNTKKVARKAWNDARYAHKTGAPTTREEYQNAMDVDVAQKVMPTFLKFLDFFWDVAEWAVVAHSGVTAGGTAGLLQHVCVLWHSVDHAGCCAC